MNAASLVISICQPSSLHSVSIQKTNTDGHFTDWAIQEGPGLNDSCGISFLTFQTSSGENRDIPLKMVTITSSIALSRVVWGRPRLGNAVRTFSLSEEAEVAHCATGGQRKHIEEQRSPVENGLKEEKELYYIAVLEIYWKWSKYWSLHKYRCENIPGNISLKIVRVSLVVGERNFRKVFTGKMCELHFGKPCQ
jgi:hypothetical protein